MNNKAKLATFFEHDDDDSFLPTTVDDAKLSIFSAGTVRKSKREKEQEAAEAKKREEEASAARAYAEFIDAFEGDGVGRKATATFVRADSRSAYAPIGPSHVPAGPRADRRSVSPPAPPRPKGKRAMDSFLEEIKREQAQREVKFSRSTGPGRSVTAMAAYEAQSGSRDRGDPLTSNVFVANLPSNVTEESLGNFFAKAGPVGSVKIMWPRADGSAADIGNARRPVKSNSLSGFVAFMSRRDAEEAVREFDGYEFGGSVLRVGWSKAVPVAAKAKYVSSSKPLRRSRSRSRERSRRHRSHSRDKRHSRNRSRSSSYSRSRSRSPRRRRSRSRSRTDDRSRSPKSRRSDSPANGDVTDTFLRGVAAEVKGHGPSYEASLMERERNNPMYSFLRSKGRQHFYYRDLVESDRTQDPEFDDDGYNSIYSTDSGEESERERERKTVLGKLARKRFEAMLRGLSGKRGEIARCMTFSLEHAEAASEVADIIIASLLVDATPVPRKVARLHLICDILHNSAAAVPSAWKFRQEFQPRLGIVFDHLANIYHSFPGRITADTFKKQITAVVGIWEDWIIFPPDFTAELRQRLDGQMIASLTETKEVFPTPMITEDNGNATHASKFKASTFKLASTEPSQPFGDNVDGEPMDEDVDGVAMDDLDGAPMDDVDGAPLDDDVDGAPLEVHDDVDGEPIDDVDGQPMQDF